MNLFKKQKEMHICRKQTYGYRGVKWKEKIWNLGLKDTQYHI